jgi:hypothetical protein
LTIGVLKAKCRNGQYISNYGLLPCPAAQYVPADSQADKTNEVSSICNLFSIAVQSCLQSKGKLFPRKQKALTTI